ncbi:MAG: prepilin peptidase [Coprobacillus cateniformis]|nr:A24 family peptidase [Coprobacillus cateniformis]
MEPIVLFLYVYMFVLGTCIASFINVVIYRLPLGLNFVEGRSFCPKCHKTLKAYDMIPVFSWFLLRGKCRFCKEPISLRYPAIEFVGGVLAVLCFYRYGIDWMTLISFVFSMILLTICMIDYDTMIIPNGLVICCLIVAIVSVPFLDLSLMDRIIGFFIISVPLYIMNLIIPDCFGGGDIKLLAVSGLLMGWINVLIGMFIAVLIAGIYAGYLLLTHRIDRKGHIAFGPYICFGVFVALLYGQELFKWYLSLFGL